MNQSPIQLVIGQGEIGTSLYNVLAETYTDTVFIRDYENIETPDPAVLHICYPYNESFIPNTRSYIERYKPELVIIHATVAPGTTRAVSEEAVHSPVRGVHPNLEEGLRTFIKYCGGASAGQAAELLEAAGMQARVFDAPETTEVMKILSTTYYGWNILFQKEAKRICDEFGLDFDEVYTEPNKDYNRGYSELGMDHVVRPVLKNVPGPIGGHCVIQNCDLMESWLTDTLRRRNQDYKEDKSDTNDAS